MKKPSQKIIIFCFVLLLTFLSATPALAGEEELLKQISTTARVLTLIVAIGVAVILLAKQQYAAFGIFLLIAILVLAIVITQGQILITISNWVANWFGAEVTIN